MYNVVYSMPTIDVDQKSSVFALSSDPKVIGLVDGGFLIAWNEGDIQAKVYDAFGNVVHDTYEITTNANFPNFDLAAKYREPGTGQTAITDSFDLVYSNDRFGPEAGTVYLAKDIRAGETESNPIEITTSNGYNPSIASDMSGNGYGYVTWTDKSISSFDSVFGVAYGLYFQGQSNMSFVGGITTYDFEASDVTVSSPDYALSIVQTSETDLFIKQVKFANLLNLANNNVVSDTITANFAVEEYQMIELAYRGAIVAYAGGGQLEVAKLSLSNGFDITENVGPEISGTVSDLVLLNSPITTQRYSSNDTYILMWNNATSNRAEGQMYDGDGNPRTNVFSVPTGGAQFDASMTADGRLVVTWEQGSQIKATVLDPRDDEIYADSFSGVEAIHLENSGIITSKPNGATIFDTPVNTTVYGLDGPDTIYGHLSSILLGEGGNDVFVADSSYLSRTIDGGQGTDTVTYVQRNFAGVSVDLEANLAEPTKQSNNSTLNATTQIFNIENVTGSIFGDYIVGNFEDNRIRGLGDYDWFVGSEGNDYYDGGNGLDMISYLNATSGVTVSLANSGLNTGLAQGDRFDNVERVTGSIFADVLYGDSGQNDLRGLGGYDTFYGSTGGRERFDGGSGLDTVTYALSGGGVVASLLNGYGSGGDAARDLYTSIENLGGTSFADRLEGDQDRNNLRGLGGDDFIFGHGGIDRIYGGRGDDYINGGKGSDYILYDGERSDYQVIRDSGTRNATVEWTGPGAGEGKDTLIGIEYLVFDDQTVDIWSL